MEVRLKAVKPEKNNKTLYNYQNAKKIYLTQTSTKLLLIEKKEESSCMTISLMTRNTTISNKKNGMRIYPKNR